MTGNLRAQLTEVLANAADAQRSWQGVLDCGKLADAVIRELGLEPETRIGPGEPGEGLSGYIRYVTGWRVDD